MNRTTRVVARLTTTFLIATVALTVLPAASKAATTRSDRATPLARGAGYESPEGSHRVRVLQRRLRWVGETPGPIDGLFGPRTEGAVLRYQQRAGLAVDGLVGPKTRAALRRSVKVAGPGAGYGMAHGSKRVRALQRSLRVAGANPGPIDGRFGPQTESAVIRFQTDHGLAADGLAGEQTMNALQRSRTRVSNPAGARRQKVERKPGPLPVHTLSSDTRKRVGPEGSGGSVPPELVILAILGLLVAIAAIFIPARMLPEETATPVAAPSPPEDTLEDETSEKPAVKKSNRRRTAGKKEGARM